MFGVAGLAFSVIGLVVDPGASIVFGAAGSAPFVSRLIQVRWARSGAGGAAALDA